MKAAARFASTWVPAFLWAWFVFHAASSVHGWADANAVPVVGKALSDFGVILVFIVPMLALLWGGNRIGMHLWPRDFTARPSPGFANPP